MQTVFNINRTIYGSEHTEIELVEKSLFDCHRIVKEMSTDEYTVEEILDIIRKSVDDMTVKFQHDTGLIRGSVSYSSDVFAYINMHFWSEYPIIINTEHYSKKQPERKVYFQLNLFGEKETIEKISKALEVVKFKKFSSATWFFMKEGKVSHQGMQIQENVHKVHDEFYPFLENGVEAFIDEYMNSTSPILILMGAPGTGKSSFIRHMITSRNLNISFTYEAEILEKDFIYIDFLNNTSKDVLFLEDCDVLLESRESTGNQTMARLLNASDGIIKIPDKKFVFTTNLANDSGIDEALLRPGRCFQVVNFRELTFQESKRVLKVMDKERELEERSYSLAELMNERFQKNSGLKQKVGFF